MHRRATRFCQTFLLLSLLLAPETARAQQRWISEATVPHSSDAFGCPIRFTLRQDVGDHIGYEQSLTQLGMFIPLSETGNQSLMFLDLQPTFYNDGEFGFNTGLGYRMYSAAHQRTYGVYGYLDYRETPYTSFRQLTLGFDSLGSLLDVRGNLYLPNQGGRQLPSDAVDASHFVRHQLRMGGYEHGMLGGDLEVGFVLPELWSTQSRLLAGVYAFDTRSDEDGVGMRARFETHWTSWLASDIAIYHDDEHGTTGVVGIELSWQPELRGRFSPQMATVRRGPSRHITRHASDRLGEPVRRLPNIAVERAAYVAQNGDQPWRFIHVVEGAVGGDGTFEKPFGRLEDAMAVAGPDDIVYTPFGGTYQPTQMLYVPEAVQLLSQVNEHWLQTQHGMVQVPYSGQSGIDAVINGSISLASGTTLNGFQIVGVADTLDAAGMVHAAGQSDILIIDNLVQSRRQGIWLKDTERVWLYGNQIYSRVEGLSIQGGTQFDIANNEMASTESEGISVSDSDGVYLTGNLVSEAAGSGVLLKNVDAAVVHENRVGTVSGSGFEMRNVEHARVSENSVAKAGRDGIEVVDGGNIAINETLVTAAARHGIGMDTVGNAQIVGNTISRAEQVGINALNAADIAITDNHVIQTGSHGIAVETAGVTRVDRNVLTSTGGDGIRISDSTLTHVAQNLMGQTYGDGIRVRSGEEVTIQENAIVESQSRGIVVEDCAAASVTGNQVHWTFGAAFRVDRTAEATISNNEVLFAGGNGFAIVDTNAITLQGNIIREAVGNGISILDGSQPVDCIADLAGNKIAHSQTGIHIELSGDFFGTVGNNVVSDSREYGMVLQVGSMRPKLSIASEPIPTSIVANQYHYNALEGLVIQVDDAGDSLVEVRNNEFKLNNQLFGVQRREFVASLAPGAGPLTVNLDDNRSYNAVPSGQFNYDFLKATGSDLLYEITEPNHGTVGSSDGSVPAP